MGGIMSDLQREIAWYLASEDFPELAKPRDSFHMLSAKAETTPYPERARYIARLVSTYVYDWEEEVSKD